MESLRFDVAPFGISTTIVEPGFFRTELLVEGASSIWPELSIDDYAERTAQTIAAWKSMNGQQGGDPAKLAAPWCSSSALDEPPLRWIAGADAVAARRAEGPRAPRPGRRAPRAVELLDHTRLNPRPTNPTHA